MLLALLVSNPAVGILVIIVLLIAFTIHEFSHGWAAYQLGDDTAKRMGRLTLYPPAHLDPAGTIFILLGGFGWGKPVPVDFRNLKNPRRDQLWIAAAGPISNLLFAIALSSVLYLFPQALIQSMYDNGSQNQLMAIRTVFELGIYINLVLAIFNLLPFYPLDGEKILLGLVSPQNVSKVLEARRYGIYVIGGLILMSLVFDISIVSMIISPFVHLLVPEWTVLLPAA